MARYRKKPVEIEAVQFTLLMERPAWLREAMEAGTVRLCGAGESTALLIETPEGAMNARWGDWVIRGIKGEIYPCKPDIFEATYDKVD